MFRQGHHQYKINIPAFSLCSKTTLTGHVKNYELIISPSNNSFCVLRFFSNPLHNPRTNNSHIVIHHNFDFEMFLVSMYVMYLSHIYLSLMILAFAKHSKADLIRIITTPGVIAAMGYWLISQNISVPGSCPRTSVPGRIEMRIIFANDIPICNTLVVYLSTPCIETATIKSCSKILGSVTDP